MGPKEAEAYAGEQADNPLTTIHSQEDLVSRRPGFMETNDACGDLVPLHAISLEI